MSKIVMPGLNPTASASLSFGRLLSFGHLLNPDTQNHFILLHSSLNLSVISGSSSFKYLITLNTLGSTITP